MKSFDRNELMETAYINIEFNVPHRFNKRSNIFENDSVALRFEVYAVDQYSFVKLVVN